LSGDSSSELVVSIEKTGDVILVKLHELGVFVTLEENSKITIKVRHHTCSVILRHHTCSVTHLYRWPTGNHDQRVTLHLNKE